MMNVPKELEGKLQIEDESNFPIQRFYVTEDQLTIFNDIVEAREIGQEMKKLGLGYMNSTILYGVPGTGKTTFAKWVAFRLGLPFVYINYAQLLDGVLGNTSKNIADIFAFIKDQECVFMLDELDCIAVKRGEESSATGGELSRITITLMQEMDKYRNHNSGVILLAATNRLDMVDAALLSRFSIQHEIKQLNNYEKEEYIKRYLESVGIPFDATNIRDYCAKNAIIRQRNIESDMNRCIIRWIKGGKKEFILDHI